VALKEIGGEKSEEAALLNLRAAACCIPLKFQTGSQIDQLISAGKVFKDQLPDNHWNIQLFEIVDLESQGFYDLSKEITPQGSAVWVHQADGRYSLIIDQYNTMFDSWRKQYAETMVPMLMRSANYLFSRAKESKNTDEVNKFLAQAKRGYIYVSEECEGKSSYNVVAASALNSAGQISLLQGKPENLKQAITFFSKALKVLDESQGNYDQDKSKILVNLANAYFKVGDPRQALYSKFEAQHLWR
jgi:hypothetical protein